MHGREGESRVLKPTEDNSEADLDRSRTAMIRWKSRAAECDLRCKPNDKLHGQCKQGRRAAERWDQYENIGGKQLETLNTPTSDAFRDKRTGVA